MAPLPRKRGRALVLTAGAADVMLRRVPNATHFGVLHGEHAAKAAAELTRFVWTAETIHLSILGATPALFNALLPDAEGTPGLLSYAVLYAIWVAVLCLISGLVLELQIGPMLLSLQSEGAALWKFAQIFMVAFVFAAFAAETFLGIPLMILGVFSSGFPEVVLQYFHAASPDEDATQARRARPTLLRDLDPPLRRPPRVRRGARPPDRPASDDPADPARRAAPRVGPQARDLPRRRRLRRVHPGDARLGGFGFSSGRTSHSRRCRRSRRRAFDPPHPPPPPPLPPPPLLQVGLSCILAAHYLWFLLALPSTTRLLACFPARSAGRAARRAAAEAGGGLRRTHAHLRPHGLVSPHRTAAPISQPAAALLAAAAPRRRRRRRRRPQPRRRK